MFVFVEMITEWKIWKRRKDSSCEWRCSSREIHSKWDDTSLRLWSNNQWRSRRRLDCANKKGHVSTYFNFMKVGKDVSRRMFKLHKNTLKFTVPFFVTGVILIWSWRMLTQGRRLQWWFMTGRTVIHWKTWSYQLVSILYIFFLRAI